MNALAGLGAVLRGSRRRGASLAGVWGAELLLARLIAGEAGCALLWLSQPVWSAAVLPHGSAGVLGCQECALLRLSLLV